VNEHDLADELTLLGRSVDAPRPSGGLSTRVLERVDILPTPAPSRPARAWQGLVDASRRWRARATVALVAVLLALLATPPVRAAVADWFGFAGVKVEQGPDLGDDAPPPPLVEGTLTVGRAAELVGFTPLVPAELGPPQRVEVSDDHLIVSMGWSIDDGPVRLDQFDGRLDYTIAKTSPGVQYANVDGTDALWFERPHEVVVLDEEGNRREESARLAGHTLIWPVGNLTMRLEGDLTLGRAIEIAESAAPYGQ
jgi:hypothetical protein